MQAEDSIRELESPLRPTPRKNGAFISLCTTHCPNLARIAELQTQLAYYRNRCEVYENRSNLVNHSSIRMSIRRVDSNASASRGMDSLDKVDINRQNREKLKEFSKRIDQRMRVKELSSAKIKTSNFKSTGTGEHINEIPLHETSQEEVQAERSLPPQILDNEEVFQSKLMVKETTEVAPPKEKMTQKLISDLCIFGLKSSTLKEQIARNDLDALPELVFSMWSLFDQEYYNRTANYMLPNGISLKKVKKEKRLQQINSIMFQNHKKQSNFIYAFKSNDMDLHHLSKEQRDLLAEINPELKLFCISIRINEFTMVECEEEDEKSVIVEPQLSEVVHLDLVDLKAPRSPLKPPKTTRQIYSSKRVLSIFTLYPFFEFFESVLIALFNELKIERLNIFQNNIETVGKLDSQFINLRLSQNYNKIMEKFNDAAMVYNYNYEFVFSGDPMRLSTERGQLAYTNLAGWIFAVLRMFTKDTFYEILVAVLMEEQVVFVCENLHILTYTIYLFTEILFRPFLYPHPCVYVVSEESFLDAITPIILGINKPLKWLQEHYDPERDTKTYVFLSDEAVIFENRKEKRPRSEKLKKLVKEFYKLYDKGLGFFKKKKEEVEYSFNASKEEKEQCLLLVNSLSYFFESEFAREVPDTESIKVVHDRIRDRIDQQKHDQASLIAQQVQKDVLRNKKDAFTEKFLKTQIFLNHLFQKIGFE